MVSWYLGFPEKQQLGSMVPPVPRGFYESTQLLLRNHVHRHLQKSPSQ